jgi:hypothetical protein
LVKALLAFAEQTRAEIGDYDRIGSEARFFDKGPKRPDMNTLATAPGYRKVLLDHRELLTRFGKEHNDPLVAELLADNVKPIPFTAGDSSAGKSRRKAKQPATMPDEDNEL